MAVRGTQKSVKSVNVKAEFKGFKDQYQEWDIIDARSTTHKWQLLATIYDLSKRIGDKGSAFEDLVAAVKSSGRIRNSNRFHIREQTAASLLIATVLTIEEETSATRSQWKKVLDAAKKEKSPPKSQSEFVAWLKDKGGIFKVITKGRSRHREKVSSKDLKRSMAPWKDVAIKYKEKFERSAVPLDIRADALPMTSLDKKVSSSFDEELALVIVKRNKDPDTGKISGLSILSVVSDPELLQAATRACIVT